MPVQDSLQVRFENHPDCQAVFDREAGIAKQRLERLTAGGNGIMGDTPFREVE